MTEPIDPTVYYSPHDKTLWLAAKHSDLVWEAAERAYWWDRCSPNAPYQDNPFVTAEFPDPPGLRVSRRAALSGRDGERRDQVRRLRADEQTAAWRTWRDHLQSLEPPRNPNTVRRERGGWYGGSYEHMDGSYRIPGRDLCVMRSRTEMYWAPWEWDRDYLEPYGLARFDAQGRPFNGPRRPLFPGGGMGTT